MGKRIIDTLAGPVAVDEKTLVKPPDKTDLGYAYLEGNIGKALFFDDDEFHDLASCKIAGGDNKGLILTVTLVDFDQDKIGNRRARVQFGSSGFQGAVANMDFQHGLTFPVPGSWVRVSAVNVGGSNPLVQCTMGAFVTLGTIGIVDAPMWSNNMGIINIGNSLTINVQPFKHFLQIFTQPPLSGGAAITAEFSEVFGPIIRYSHVFQGDSFESVPIQGSIFSIRLRNTGTVNFTEVLAIQSGNL